MKPPSPSRVPSWVGSLVVALAGLLVTLDAALLQGALFLLDIQVQNLPFRAAAFRQLSEGFLPLWSSELALGLPLLAEGQAGVLYPAHLLYLALPAWSATNLITVIHLLLAGQGLYWLLRRLRADPGPAAFGAISFQLGQYLLDRYALSPVMETLVWTPWILLAIDRSLERGAGRRSIWPAAILAMQTLIGHPQALLISLLTATLYLLWVGWFGEGLRLRSLVWRLLPLLAAPVVLGAVQWLPTAELLLRSPRAGGLTFERFTAVSLPPHRLLGLLLPHYFGNPATASYWSAPDGYSWELTAYPGVLAWLLLPLGLHRRQGRAGALALLTGVGILLALGPATPLARLLFHLPGLDVFRIPGRFLFLPALAVPALAALGLQRLREGAAPRAGPVVAGGLVAAGLVFALGQAGSRVGTAGLASFNRRVLQEILLDTGILAVAAAAGLGILAAMRRGRARRIGPWLIALIATLDLACVWFRWHRTVPPEVVASPPPLARKICSTGHPGRVLSLVREETSPFRWHRGWATSRRDASTLARSLKMYGPAAHGIATCAFDGWSPLHTQRFRRVSEIVLSPAGLDLLGARYIVDLQSLPEAYPLLARDGPFRLVENPGALPLVTLVPTVARVRPGKGLRSLYDPEFRPPSLLLLEGRGLESRSSASPGELTWNRTAPGRLEIHADVHRPAGLLVLESHDPGWKAEIDGEDLVLAPADHLFLGAILPEGEHRIRLRFEPSSFRVGLFLSLAGLAALAAFLPRRERRTCRSFRETPGILPHPGRLLALLLAAGVLSGLLFGSGWMGIHERLRLPEVLQEAQDRIL